MLKFIKCTQCKHLQFRPCEPAVFCLLPPAAVTSDLAREKGDREDQVGELRSQLELRETQSEQTRSQLEGQVRLVTSPLDAGLVPRLSSGSQLVLCPAPR